MGRKSKGGKKTERPVRSGHDVTSGPDVFGPRPKRAKWGRGQGRRRSPVDVLMADHLTPQFRSLLP